MLFQGGYFNFYKLLGGNERRKSLRRQPQRMHQQFPALLLEPAILEHALFKIGVLTNYAGDLSFQSCTSVCSYHNVPHIGNMSTSGSGSPNICKAHKLALLELRIPRSVSILRTSKNVYLSYDGPRFCSISRCSKNLF